MSLLIDALKQAEASRRQAEQPGSAESADSESLALEPLTTLEQANVSGTTGATPAPNTSRTSFAGGTGRTANALAARELFEVKQKTPNRVPLIIAIIGLSFLVIGGAYLWWATHPHGLEPGPGLTSTTMNPIVNPAAALSPSTTAVAPSSNISSPTATPPETLTQIAPAQVDSPVRISQHRNARHGDKAVAPQTPAQESDITAPAVRHSDPETQNTSPSLVQRAYAAWQSGDLAQARSRYNEALQQEPNNLDALDALGMIALRNRQPDIAERYFRDALVVDPKDATAVSQLALLYADTEPVAAESRLRSLLAGQPNSGIANFALGSLLAKQNRWSEAQQVFFQAYTLDGGNPDILYNLAISLDHLGQSKPAQQYYERAIRAAALRPASFDPAAARVRAQALANANTTR